MPLDYVNRKKKEKEKRRKRKKEEGKRKKEEGKGNYTIYYTNIPYIIPDCLETQDVNTDQQ